MNKGVSTKVVFLCVVRKLLLCPERYWYARFSALLCLFETKVNVHASNNAPQNEFVNRNVVLTTASIA
eukprot:1689169-Amphidinium_carterae.1